MCKVLGVILPYFTELQSPPPHFFFGGLHPLLNVSYQGLCNVFI